MFAPGDALVPGVGVRTGASEDRTVPRDFAVMRSRKERRGGGSHGLRFLEGKK